jgi:hypothetical protein
MSENVDPRDTIIGGLLGISYDLLNHLKKLDGDIMMPQFEVNTAGLAVAHVCGAIPGVIAGKMGMPVWVVPPASFAVSWWVCENLFPKYHEVYGSGSVWHRAYDLNSIVSGILMYYVVKNK